MKRLLVLVLCLVLALTAVSAQAVSLAQIVGRWYFVSMDGRGLGGENYIEFNRNKSVTLIINGQPQDLSAYEWKLYNEDTVEVLPGGDKYAPAYLRFDVTDAGLSLTTDNLAALSGNTFYPTFTLSREKAEYHTPAAVIAAVEEEFFGDYTAYLAISNGQYVPLDSSNYGIEIVEFVANVTGDGQTTEYLTNFEDGKLIVYADEDTIVSRTEDPDVLLMYAAATPDSRVYARRKGAAEPEPVPQATAEPAAPAMTVEPAAPTPAPITQPILPTLIPAAPAPVLPTAAPVAPAPQPAEPAKPVFPGLIMPGALAPAAESAPVSAFFGSYIVYQDKLANGRVLDMTAYGLKASIDADGVHATVYGRSVTVPFNYESGKMTADISAVSPDYGFATATLGDNGELVVTLADATGYVAETLYLKPEN